MRTLDCIEPYCTGNYYPNLTLNNRYFCTKFPSKQQIFSKTLAELDAFCRKCLNFLCLETMKPCLKQFIVSPTWSEMHVLMNNFGYYFSQFWKYSSIFDRADLIAIMKNQFWIVWLFSVAKNVNWPCSAFRLAMSK